MANYMIPPVGRLPRGISRFLLLFCFAGAAVSVGCGGSLSDHRPSGTVRVFNALPSATEIDASFEGGSLGTQISFGSDGGPLVVDPGNHQISVVRSGTGTPLVELEQDVKDRGAYNIFVTRAPGSVVPIVRILNDDSKSLANNQTEGHYALYFINMSPSAPEIDVYVLDGKQTLGDVQPVFKGLRFGDSTDFIDQAAGPHRFVFVDRTTRQVMIDSGEITIADSNTLGNTFALVALDKKGGGLPGIVANIFSS